MWKSRDETSWSAMLVLLINKVHWFVEFLAGLTVNTLQIFTPVGWHNSHGNAIVPILCLRQYINLMVRYSMYHKVASSRPVYYSILEHLGKRSHYISIKFPLHKPSGSATKQESILLATLQYVCKMVHMSVSVNLNR